MTPFETALSFTLHWEGGYVDNPADPGGATNEGVTQATYDRFRVSRGELNQSVELISDDEVAAIYSQMYWLLGHCQDLPLKLAVCHFDWCVNHGVSGAIKTLQVALGVNSDGIFGAGTTAAVQRMVDTKDEPDTIKAYLQLRRVRYQSIAQVNPAMMQFLKGWLSRVNDLQSYLSGLGD